MLNELGRDRRRKFGNDSRPFLNRICRRNLTQSCFALHFRRLLSFDCFRGFFLFVGQSCTFGFFGLSFFFRNPCFFLNFAFFFGRSCCFCGFLFLFGELGAFSGLFLLSVFCLSFFLILPCRFLCFGLFSILFCYS